MTDVLSPDARSKTMKAIRGKNTKPELVVRKVLRELGVKYRIHAAKIPGTPDIAIAGSKKIVFVHGCFWHRHSCRKGRSMPSTNTDFWTLKLHRNMVRDRCNRRAAKRLGWSSLVVWECQTGKRKLPILKRKLELFLES